RVTDVRSAQQLGSLVVLPLVVFLIVSLSGLATVDPWFMLAFAGLVMLVDLVMLFITMKAFRREEILIKWK
ncbi:MAG TPA: hypothetical protein VLH13_00910, partial [Methanomassiliicoccales archaeon]|nr:hypothetical protein [Methanomassiliicoccales archaeon]